jgi:hypothetical protein
MAALCRYAVLKSRSARIFDAREDRADPEEVDMSKRETEQKSDEALKCLEDAWAYYTELPYPVDKTPEYYEYVKAA